jgi:alanine racemase
MSKKSNNRSETNARVELAASALANNVDFLRSLSGGSSPLLCAPVKANAYGHGLPEVVRLLKKLPVDYIAVHSLAEAWAARKAGWKKNILAVGYIALGETAEALALDVEPSIYNSENLLAWKSEASAQKKTAQIHLKIETGTNRQGASGAELVELLEILKKSRRLKFRGISTHFANIEDTTDHGFALAQLKRFKQALKLCEKYRLSPEIRHTASSAAHLVVPETRFDMIRPGIALYGHWPSRETLLSFRHAQKDKADTAPLKAVLSLKSRIAQIKTISKGETVGYGLTYRAARKSRIAVLPLGYSDGLPRALSGIAYALVNGKRAPYLGRVSMNNLVIDITGLRGVALEDEVTLIGCSGSEEITIEQIAAWSGTINYEALARIGAHLVRVVV